MVYLNEEVKNTKTSETGRITKVDGEVITVSFGDKEARYSINSFIEGVLVYTNDKIQELVEREKETKQRIVNDLFERVREEGEKMKDTLQKAESEGKTRRHGPIMVGERDVPDYNKRIEFWDIVKQKLDSKKINYIEGPHYKERANYLKIKEINNIEIGLKISGDKAFVQVWVKTENSLEVRDNFCKNYNTKYNTYYAQINNLNDEQNSHSACVYYSKSAFARNYEESANELLDTLDKVLSLF